MVKLIQHNTIKEPSIHFIGEARKGVEVWAKLIVFPRIFIFRFKVFRNGIFSRYTEWKPEILQCTKWLPEFISVSGLETEIFPVFGIETGKFPVW